MRKTFAEYIQDVRAAKKGVEVREALAEGLDYVREFAEKLPAQMQAAITSAAEAKKARSAAAESAESAAASSSAASSSASAASRSAAAAKTSEANAKTEADRAAAIASTDKTLSFSGAAADAAAVGVRLKLLELSLGIAVEGNAFTTSFDTLDNITLDGVWNKAEKRIEF